MAQDERTHETQPPTREEGQRSGEGEGDSPTATERDRERAREALKACRSDRFGGGPRKNAPETRLEFSHPEVEGAVPTIAQALARERSEERDDVYDWLTLHGDRSVLPGWVSIPVGEWDGTIHDSPKSKDAGNP